MTADVPKKLLLILHGTRAEQPAIRRMVEWVRAKGHEVDPRVTWEPGDAARFARDAVRLGADVAIAVGGDGTINEVLNGLDGSKVALGIIPVGTANDFARQVGIPDDPDHAMDVILQRKPVRIDTASLNGRRFLNVSTGGMGAEATAETPPEAKEQLGPLAYALTGVRKLADLQATRAHFSGKGFELEGEFLIFGVGNARVTGGGTMIAPRASLTDGLLDICVVESMPLPRLSRVLLKLRRGQHVGEEGVHYAQLPALEIEAERAVSVNVDGESLESARLSYRSRPRDLLVHVARLPERRRSQRQDARP
ncbi:MAG: YegS/Rv2252/BmrU family lipid kinase [Gemmatimonadota bacterium]|nr:YegS/Rv2252/BmrU family lipid kinase [Gemmatimonadota bacterium]